MNLKTRVQLTKKLADARCCVTINQSLYTIKPYIICANRTIEKEHRLRVCQQLFFLWKYKKPDKIELFVVRITGVEPAWAQCSHGPEPCASAYSAISAYSFLPSEFLHGREVRTEVELIAWSTFCKTSRNFASSPTWCNLNHARLPIPPYLQLCSLYFYTARVAEAEHIA